MINLTLALLSADCSLLCACLALPQGNDYALRYHDLHANRFLRYFRGHTGRVTTLAMSPRSDAFLSAAQDKQARVCVCVFARLALLRCTPLLLCAVWCVLTAALCACTALCQGLPSPAPHPHPDMPPPASPH